MNQQSQISIEKTKYNRGDCKIGIVHLGFGSFHRAHQAVYIDDYMDATGDLDWGIAAVNLRAQESASFKHYSQVSGSGYILKTTTPEGESSFREIRSHVHFVDWSADAESAEALLAKPTVKAVTVTVTESGYYLDDSWQLDPNDSVIAAEIAGETATSVYAYLSAGLSARQKATCNPITVLCCDNIRSNGEKLRKNFHKYLELTGQVELLDWVKTSVCFPNSMVDRITPRPTDLLSSEIALIAPEKAETAIHGESYTQWVLESNFATSFPDLEQVGAEFVDDVDPYEEAKIRILNGGHTALCYLGALAGYQTFDQVMFDPSLRNHFDGFETENVLPGLTLELPFSKEDYRDLIADRFSNSAIADDLGRICMDGWSKFPIFIRPTLKSCLKQNIQASWCYDSIASWYVYARRFAKGQIHIHYIEPYWDHFAPLLKVGKEAEFAASEALWSNLPETYPEFVPEVISAIARMEEKWPV